MKRSAHAVQDEILRAALEYERLGFSLIPMLEKQPAVRWKQYQTRRATPAQLARWYRKHPDWGIAVIFGGISGDLASRDFDDMASYEKWAGQFPHLAGRLPTVQTKRGRHVYCRLTAPEVRNIRQAQRKPDGTGAISFADGELRVGVGCYSVLPPSCRRGGFQYAWLTPLPAEIEGLPYLSLAESGFAEHYRENAVNRENRGGRTRVKVGVEKGSQKNEKLDSPEISTDQEAAIFMAITETLPTEYGTRRRRIFEFARRLQGIPELAARDPLSFRPYLKQWHSRALPHIRTQPFEETWADFLEGWPLVKFPVIEGEHPLTAILQLATSRTPPPCTADFDQDALRLLVVICRELQRAAGSDPFFLSCRTAGRLVAVSFPQAARWLRFLCNARILELVDRGNVGSRRASRYRYLEPLEQVSLVG